MISSIIQDLRKDLKAYTVDLLFSSLIDAARGKEKDSILLTKARVLSKTLTKAKKTNNKSKPIKPNKV